MELAKLRDAFLAHPRAASIMRCWAGDATQMPCVGVECANTEVTARGLVVGGTIVDGEWDLDGKFLLFTTDDNATGDIFIVSGSCGAVKEIERLAAQFLNLKDKGKIMDAEQTRREMDALFPGLDQNERLQASFESHPGSAAFLELQPELGRTIPWVLVRCDVNGRQITGLVVDGIVVRHGWDLREEFVIFSTDTGRSGRFMTIPAGSDAVSVVGTVPARAGVAARADAAALLREMAEVSGAWAANAELVRSWQVSSVLHRLPSYPDCFAEFHRDGEVTRGLVIGGHVGWDGQWDFSQSVQLIVRSGDTLMLDPTQAEHMEVLHGHVVPQSNRF